jgi:hypothetical protein
MIEKEEVSRGGENKSRHERREPHTFTAGTGLSSS